MADCCESSFTSTSTFKRQTLIRITLTEPSTGRIMPVNSKLSRPSTRSRREITFAMTGGDARPAPGSAPCVSNIFVCARIYRTRD